MSQDIESSVRSSATKKVNPVASGTVKEGSIEPSSSNDVRAVKKKSVRKTARKVVRKTPARKNPVADDQVDHGPKAMDPGKPSKAPPKDKTGSDRFIPEGHSSEKHDTDREMKDRSVDRRRSDGNDPRNEGRGDDNSSRNESGTDGQGQPRGQGGRRQNHQRDMGGRRSKQRNNRFPKRDNNDRKGRNRTRKRGRTRYEQLATDTVEINIGELPEADMFQTYEAFTELIHLHSSGETPIFINTLYATPLQQLIDESRVFGVNLSIAPTKGNLVDEIMKISFEREVPLRVEGVLEMQEDGYGLITFEHDNYRIKPYCPFVPEVVITRFGLKRGHVIDAFIHPHREGESCPYVIKINKIVGLDPEEAIKLEPFVDLVPYYPLERMLLETNPDVKWDNLSMRVVDMLTPVGLGQRGIIVAPPRTGKTVLLQGIANSVAENYPDVHLIVLLVDERPEEVTDFRRQTKGEVISSTFDEAAESHVHAAEMVIEKARRLCEAGRDVVILLDSITRLARAYNATMPSSGKILSGGVEANALQKPKRFFGTARNIEGGGSVTIIATALVETGSRMDEVIFEEFKGTGNMELHLDRALIDKRVFPAISLEKSGTRKEELLYHPDEMVKIYSLRRAMKGVPSPEAMEMLILRVRKTKTNAEFLMGINR